MLGPSKPLLKAATRLVDHVNADAPYVIEHDVVATRRPDPFEGCGRAYNCRLAILRDQCATYLITLAGRRCFDAQGEHLKGPTTIEASAHVGTLCPDLICALDNTLEAAP